MFEDIEDGIAYFNRMNISNVQFSPYLMSNSSLLDITHFPKGKKKKTNEHRKKTNRISHFKNMVYISLEMCTIFA